MKRDFSLNQKGSEYNLSTLMFDFLCKDWQKKNIHTAMAMLNMCILSFW